MKKILITIILGIFLVSMISAVGEASYCCERTNDGAWCQNSPEDSCDDSYKTAPTSCEATAYCRLGTCIDSVEGTCMDNTPGKICEAEEGVWKEGDTDDLEQCQLGCCLIGDQAAFVTQTSCKRLSAKYGLETNYRTDIGSEIVCIASATSDIKGACVFEKEYEITCSFITKNECDKLNVEGSETTFYLDTLCSAESLETNCGSSKQTTCVDGRDEVYFLDTCGNLANIYDASKVDSDGHATDQNYWAEIKTKGESCNSGESNADSATCGSCDYFLGSTCRDYDRTEDNRRPSFGDYICRDLSCTYEGKRYSHGETWCAEAAGTSEIIFDKDEEADPLKENLAGSRYSRLVCYNGEVNVEPCADFRQEVCIASEIEGFSTAACRVNMWQDCASQEDEDDCENTDKRDCKWVDSYTVKCVAKYSPGFNFWEAEGEAEDLCGAASTTCIVTYEKSLGGSKECVDNCECIGQGWEDKMNEACVSIGDCGVKDNYLRYEGYNDED
ncbi:hypothetical protein GOV13_01870 [Candidatus Pacearchaeota archaeon]|nr:hypothetical protein [Candidatus Pacearchaeota archaeon]